MKTVALLRSSLLIALGLGSIRAFAQSSFYGGDPDLKDALSSEVNTGVIGTLIDGYVYDDFMLGTAGAVTSVFGNFAADTTITGLHYEIRSGVKEFNGGTLLASGDLAATVVDTGLSFVGRSVYRVSGSPVGVSLQPGAYFLNVSVIGSGPFSGRAFLMTTSGQNGVGGPLGDDNSFFSSKVLNYSFIKVADLNVGDDYSMGIVTRPVPEPATVAVLSLGALGLLRRRARR